MLISFLLVLLTSSKGRGQKKFEHNSMIEVGRFYNESLVPLFDSLFNVEIGKTISHMFKKFDKLVLKGVFYLGKYSIWRHYLKLFHKLSKTDILQYEHKQRRIVFLSSHCFAFESGIRSIKTKSKLMVKSCIASRKSGMIQFKCTRTLFE